MLPRFLIEIIKKCLCFSPRQMSPVPIVLLSELCAVAFELHSYCCLRVDMNIAQVLTFLTVGPGMCFIPLVYAGSYDAGLYPRIYMFGCDDLYAWRWFLEIFFVSFLLY